MKIEDVKNVFTELFQNEENALVKSIETVYEKGNDDDYLKLVIGIHGLSVEDTSIIHTKFIFKTDIDKINLKEDSFIYLYDINCIYHKVNFDSETELKSKIKEIVSYNNFGEDIKSLSDFIEAPAMFLNYYLKKEKITDFSIFEVIYDPKFKLVSCDKTTFDFKVNINNQYNIDITIAKVNVEKGEDNIYKFTYKFINDIITVEESSLENLQSTLGEGIAKILEAKLKNKT